MLGVSPATVKRSWMVARAWLKKELGGRVTREQWARVNALFHDALARPAADRVRWLAGADRRPGDRARGAGAARRARERRRLPRVAGGGVRRDDGGAARRAPLVGRIIGAYEIEREIGRGGMGVVYLARRHAARPRRRAQGAVGRGGTDPARREPAAARGAGGGVAGASGHRHRLRARGGRRRLLPDHRVPAGPHAARRAGRRAAAGRPLAAAWRIAIAEARRRRARAGHRPSRSQARERHAHRRRRDQGARLRPGPRDDAARAPASRRRSRRPARWSGRPATWRPSRSAASRSTPAPTSSPSACCSTSSRRASTRSAPA